MQTDKLSDLVHIGENVFRTPKPTFNKPYVTERFILRDKTVNHIQSLKPKFGYNGYGEFIFYRTYSRIKSDGSQETWNDCVLRVISGVMTIRKDWYVKHGIKWIEEYWQNYASEMAVTMFRMEWLPPGRGMWAMGTDYIYESGSLSLFNCGYMTMDDIPNDIHWMMDALMNGVGVGFEAIEKSDIKVYEQGRVGKIRLIIDDSREGWCDATKFLLRSYLEENVPEVELLYNEIRPAGLPIKRFGGISSGPDSLIKFHKYIRKFMQMWRNDIRYGNVRLKSDIANCVGCCVVAGNVRRSAELCVGDINDSDFLDLKDYEKYPYRGEHGWMANNTARLCESKDFEKLPEIANRVIVRGEPGAMNQINIREYGRVGKNDNLKLDDATGLNPCAEIPLCPFELCNVNDTCPTVSQTDEDWLKSCEYASFYCSTVTLLPTHRNESNKIIAKNRRIGVGIIDYTGWKKEKGVAKITKLMREGYKIVRKVNKELAEEAGIPESIRVTTVKPGGTGPKLPGKTSGIGHPTFDYTIRRTRIQMNSPMFDFLHRHNVPHEQDLVSANTEVFDYPILQGPARPADEVTLWEQAMNLVLVQREWADNAVSNTLYFRPKWRLVLSRSNLSVIDYAGLIDSALVEYNFGHTYFTLDYYKTQEIILNDEVKIVLVYSQDSDFCSINIYEYDVGHEEEQIEEVLSSIAPLIKSVSLLPHSVKGAYLQMPEEGITKEQYEEMLAKIIPMDWTTFEGGTDGLDEKYCTGPQCELPQKS